MYPYGQNSSSINHVTPSDSQIMEKIKGSSNEELQTYLDDDQKIIDMINSSQQIKTLKDNREKLLIENKRIANENKGYEPELWNGKTKLAEEYQKLKGIKTINNELRSSIESYSDKYSPNNMLTLLMGGMSEAEDFSEKCADEFMSGQTDVDKFIESFIEKRNQYHERRIKADQLQELINTQGLSFHQSNNTGILSSSAAPILSSSHASLANHNAPNNINHSQFNAPMNFSSYYGPQPPMGYPGQNSSHNRPMNDIGFKY